MTTLSLSLNKAQSGLEDHGKENKRNDTDVESQSSDLKKLAC